MTKRYLPKLTVCQNCETPTPGNFCPECGQDSRDHRVALRLLIVGLWNDLFTFDNRFWHSLLMLLTRPGQLTLLYMGGQRVRYIPPARLYLFVSIIFFFLFSVAATNDDDLRPSVTVHSNPAVAAADTVQVGSGGLPAESAVDPDDNIANGTLMGRKYEIREDYLVGTVLKLASKGMFVLLPVFAALLALVYRRSHRMYVEHLIFSLHYHSFVFILLIATELIPWDGIVLIDGLVFNVYLYLAMKHVYGQGWWKTWFKYFLLTGAYSVALFLFVAMIVAGSILLTSWAVEYPKWLGWAV